MMKSVWFVLGTMIQKFIILLSLIRQIRGTSINLKPIVRDGDRVTKGQVLCEGYATEEGELALGRNMKVAFMPWKGYNFEDAIVISERVVTRRYIYFYCILMNIRLEVRDTKRGEEELTIRYPKRFRRGYKRP